MKKSLGKKNYTLLDTVDKYTEQTNNPYFCSSEETTSCIIISSIESNSDGVTDVSFFVITGDGSARGILPFDVMKDAVEVSYY